LTYNNIRGKGKNVIHMTENINKSERNFWMQGYEMEEYYLPPSHPVCMDESTN
jgi:hypothetical protein